MTIFCSRCLFRVTHFCSRGLFRVTHFCSRVLFRVTIFCSRVLFRVTVFCSRHTVQCCHHLYGGQIFNYTSFVPGDHILFPCFVPGDCFLFPTYSTVSPIQPIRFELCLIEPIGVVQKPLGNTERHTENMEC